MLKAWNHFMTINKHKYKVMVHCYKAGIFWQGLRHDLSKYSPSEFIVGARYYSGQRSPNEAEREVYGYSGAWLHHKGRNKHHFEYWNDYNPKTKQIEPIEMPLRYVKEMFCDRVAASKTYLKGTYTNTHPLDYFLNGKERRNGAIHPATSKLLEEWLMMLATKGEEETFNHIKKLK